MSRKLLSFAVGAVIIAAVAGIGWVAYDKFSASEAVEFDTSVSMVEHQTGALDESLDDAGAFVRRDVKQISSISVLLDEWTPRYSEAKTAYRKFDAAIIAAEARAQDYFSTQRALTEQFHDPEKQARARADDDADYALYKQWEEQAYFVRERALEIVHRLDDMDTDLQKLKLSSEFRFDELTGFNEVPMEILSLEDDLEEFQIASENIRRITGPSAGGWE